jgi:hypothetical protein
MIFTPDGGAGCASNEIAATTYTPFSAYGSEK